MIPAAAITESRLQYALSLVLSFEFEVWQDAERNTGRDRLDRRGLQQPGENIETGGTKIGVKSGAQKSERTREKRRSAGVR